MNKLIVFALPFVIVVPLSWALGWGLGTTLRLMFA